MRLNLPLFIVFKGIDGSGKTSLSERVYKYYLKNGVPIEKKQEPTQGYIGRQIRDLLRTKGASADELLKLFLKDREYDVKRNILPSLESGKMIIMDRYYFSNAAYQGAMGISPIFIIQENRRLKFPEPHRVYLIDIDPDTAIENACIQTAIYEKRRFF